MEASGVEIFMASLPFLGRLYTGVLPPPERRKDVRGFQQFVMAQPADGAAHLIGAEHALAEAPLVQAPAGVVFYCMATSSAEDVPRTLDFLFSRNRLNVAVSRAMCLACIVAGPRLLESRARTIEQMRLIHALCRFTEMAGAQVT